MLKQQLKFKLSQKLSPQQIQLMKLIQLPTQAFEQRVKQELEDNPALDSGKEKTDEYEFEDEFKNEDQDTDSEVIETEINVDEYLSDDEIPNYRLQANNYSKDDDEKTVPYASGTSFSQHLKTQLQTFRLKEDEMQIAEFLVGSVDESGYIRRDVPDIVDDLAFTQNVYTDEETVERIFKIVHQLDPAGVGARNLQECLLIQLKRRNETASVELAEKILKDAFDQFTKKHYNKLLAKFDITEDQLRDAIDEIEHLNPKPGGTYSGNLKPVEHVTPDFTIKIKDGELELSLNGRNAPQMHVSREYNNMLKGYKESKKKTKEQTLPSK